MILTGYKIVAILLLGNEVLPWVMPKLLLMLMTSV